MKSNLVFYVILILISLQGCRIQSNRNESRLPVKSTIACKNNISKVSIKTKIPEFNLFDIYQDSLTDYLLLYDKNSLLLEITNLNTNELIFSKPLSAIFEMPNEFEEVNSIEFVNFDTIFIVQNGAIKLIDTTKERFMIKINSIDDKNYDNCTLTNLDHAPIYYDQNNNSISIQSYCHTCYRFKDSYFKAPIHVSFSLNDYKFIPLPLNYSKIYLENYFGFHDIVFRSEYRDKFIVGFSADPYFYIYSKSEKLEKKVNGRSKFQLLEVEPIKKKYKDDSNEKLKHLTLSPIYKEILYDEKRNLYYRFLLNGINEKNQDGTFNGWQDKELILMVFDGELKLIKELNLGRSIYNSSKSFVGDKGLYLNCFTQTDSTNLNILNYDIYEFH
jgi:hypothetical protein